MQNEFPRIKGLDESVMPWIGKVSKMMGIFLKERFKEHGVDLTREQFILLKVLHDEDGKMQKDLAFITERNKGSLARLITTMEKKNYVARIPSTEDKRINKIYLTKHGHKIFEQIQPVLYANIAHAQKGLTQEEINTTIAVLKKVHENLCASEGLPIVQSIKKDALEEKGSSIISNKEII